MTLCELALSHIDRALRFVREGFGDIARNIRLITPSHYEKVNGCGYFIVAKSERRSHLNPSKVYTYVHPRLDFERNSKELARLADAPVQIKAFIEQGTQKLKERNHTVRIDSSFPNYLLVFN